MKDLSQVTLMSEFIKEALEHIKILVEQSRRTETIRFIPLSLMVILFAGKLATSERLLLAVALEVVDLGLVGAVVVKLVTRLHMP